MAKLTIFGCFLFLACTSQALSPSESKLSLTKDESNTYIGLNAKLSQTENVAERAFWNLDSRLEDDPTAVKNKKQKVQPTANTMTGNVGTTIDELIQFVEGLGKIYETEHANPADSSVPEDDKASEVSEDNEAFEVTEDEAVDAVESSVTKENEAPELSEDEVINVAESSVSENDKASEVSTDNEASEVSEDEVVDDVESSLSKNIEASEVSTDKVVDAAESSVCEDNEASEVSEDNKASEVSEDEVQDTAESSNTLNPAIIPWPYMLVYYPAPVFLWPQYPSPSKIEPPTYPWSYLQPLYPPQGKMDPSSLSRKESH